METVKEKELKILIKNASKGDHFACSYIGNYYFNTKNYGKAIEWYEKAINCMGKDSKVYHYYNNLGICYRVIGDINKAIECYSKSKNYKQSYCNLGSIYESIDKDKSLEYYLKAMLYGSEISCDKIKKLINKLKIENEQLKTEIKYMPGGLGFKECEKEFETLANK